MALTFFRKKMYGSSELNFPDNVIMFKILVAYFSTLIIGLIITSPRSFFGQWKKLKTDVIIFVTIVNFKACYDLNFKLLKTNTIKFLLIVSF